MANETRIEQRYELAKERYAELGVDTDAALKALVTIPISLHCWQGDDVAGFEGQEGLSGGGIMATGNYPGRARTPDELRQDLEQAYRLLPGKHRLNLHAIYGEFGGKAVDRDEIEVEHFQGWIDWAKTQGIGLDFNPTCFSHDKAADGFTLASLDSGIRSFWIEHCQRTRAIASEMGRQLGSPCVNNVWIPDGFKDIPIDRRRHRSLLMDALDEVFDEDYDEQDLLDAVESKLFGIGSESCVIGSHEFYLGYAISREKLYCLDAGHYHPTELISDKISSCLMYMDELLLHVSRGVRWDSDHVVILNEELVAIAQEIVRNGYQDRVHIGLDFFDASINRVAAWTIGTRAMIKALLLALLEPTDTLRELEAAGTFTDRLALLEELKSMPFGAVWDAYCLQQETPVGTDWLAEVHSYEKAVQSKR